MDPIADIVAEREIARQRQDPHVDTCFLATVNSHGRPEVRAVSLRDVGPQGFGLLLNIHSPKWQQIEQHGQCSLLILWSTVRRQYRVYGALQPMEPQRLLHYWQRKTHGSRLLEYYYSAFQQQSQPIPGRNTLLEGIAALTQRYPDKDAMQPPQSLRGVYLVPVEIDVWHGSPEDRLHDRHVCRRTAAGWECRTVVP